MKELLNELIKYKTLDMNFEYDDEFVKCLNCIKNYLKDQKLYFKDYIFNGKRSLVVSNTEDKNLDIIFCGHIDVVIGKDEQFNPVIKDNIMYGRGTYDMKGHDAVMIEVMKNLDTNYKVALFLTSDEEYGGFNGTDLLLNQEGYNAKLAIVPDGGNNFDLVVEEKGVYELELSYIGVPAHGSTPYLGVNPIVKLFEIYQKLLEVYPMPKDNDDFRTSINLGYLNGGNFMNRVPDFAKMGLDIRHVTTDTKKEIYDAIRKIDKDVIIDTFEESFEFKYIESDLSKEYLKIAEKVLGRKINEFKCASSSDARFFYSKGISTIIMNASGNDMHGDNEYIELDSLDKLYEIYNKFINR